MKKSNRIAALVLIVFGVAAVYEAIEGIGIGSLAEPGSGFYPFLLAGVLAGLSALLLFANLGRDENPQPFWEAGAWRRPVRAIAVLGGFLILVFHAGFITATACLFFAWMKIVEKEPAVKSAIVAASGAAFVYLVFIVVMGVSFPEALLI